MCSCLCVLLETGRPNGGRAYANPGHRVVSNEERVHLTWGGMHDIVHINDFARLIESSLMLTCTSPEPVVGSCSLGRSTPDTGSAEEITVECHDNRVLYGDCTGGWRVPGPVIVDSKR